MAQQAKSQVAIRLTMQRRAQLSELRDWILERGDFPDDVIQTGGDLDTGNCVVVTEITKSDTALAKFLLDNAISHVHDCMANERDCNTLHKWICEGLTPTQASDRAIKEWDWSGVDEHTRAGLLTQLLDTIKDWAPITHEEVEEKRELRPESRDLELVRRAGMLAQFNRDKQENSNPDQSGSES